MTRRELIQKTTMALGYSISAPTLMGILNGCYIKHELTYKPVFFNEGQALLIAELAEIILPRTKTPGAKDVGVPAFIDSFIREVYPKPVQEKFLKDLEAFSKATINKHARLFMECTPDLQKLYVHQVHQEEMKKQSTSVSEGWWSEGWWNNNKAERPFFLKVKELTILGFFTSQQGATQVLQYNPAPGPYQGCVPLASVGKAWAT